jgi:hypothetical protein
VEKKESAVHNRAICYFLALIRGRTSRSGAMLLRAQTMNIAGKSPQKVAPKRTAPNAKTGGKAASAVAARPGFTMQSLWRQALWGSTAAVALAVAVLSTRGEVASQRAAVILSALHMPSPATPRPPQTPMQVASRSSGAANAARPYDAEAADRQLAQEVRSLAEDRDKINMRLAAIEHNVDDMTGSIRQEIEAAKKSSAAAAEPPLSAAPPPPVAAPAPATVAAITPPTAAAPAAPLPQPPAPLSEATATAVPGPLEYGVDLGSGPTMKSLRARWLSIAAGHPELLASMAPVVAVRERAGRSELRLIAGPMTSPEAAARVCAALLRFRLACRPSVYEGQQLVAR